MVTTTAAVMMDHSLEYLFYAKDNHDVCHQKFVMTITTKIHILLIISDVAIPPNSPNRPLTLCPTTGKRLMKAEGEKTPEPTPPPSPKSMINIDDTSMMNRQNDNSTLPTLIKV